MSKENPGQVIVTYLASSSPSPFNPGLRGLFLSQPLKDVTDKTNSISYTDSAVYNIKGVSILILYLSYFLMRKQAMDSLFSSMALCRRVCWHFPGPSDQRSTSHPCFTYKSNRKMFMYMFYNSASFICIITGTLFKYTCS